MAQLKASTCEAGTAGGGGFAMRMQWLSEGGVKVGRENMCRKGMGGEGGGGRGRGEK